MYGRCPRCKRNLTFCEAFGCSHVYGLSCLRLLGALFQFGKRAAGKAAKLGRSGVEFFGVVGAARLECSEPATKARELIWRQFGDSFGDLFNFHAATIYP